MSNERRFVGSKYEETKNIGNVAITALIRKEIRAAVKAGILLPGKYSVRNEHYTSINVTVSFGDVVPWTQDYLDATENLTCPKKWGVLKEYTPEVEHTLETIRAIGNKYNYDDSDAMVDHFDNRFYYFVNIDWRWRQAFEQSLKQVA